METLLKRINLSSEYDRKLSLQKAHWVRDDIELYFELDHGIKDSQNSAWKITAQSARESQILEANFSDFHLYKEDHVLIKKYTDQQANLFFLGSSPSPETVVVQLIQAHRECVEDWFTFEEHINTDHMLSNLLDGGFGRLASGPIFLLKVDCPP